MQTVYTHKNRIPDDVPLNTRIEYSWDVSKDGKTISFMWFHYIADGGRGGEVKFPSSLLDNGKALAEYEADCAELVRERAAIVKTVQDAEEYAVYKKLKERFEPNAELVEKD